MGVRDMQNPYFDLLKSAGELQARSMERSRELWRSYSEEVQKLAIDAQGKARELWQSYQQELRAAGAGEDFAERIATARSKFQHSYAELDERYVRACREREQNLAESLTALSAEYGQLTIDGTIRYLEAIRASLPKATPEAPADSGKS
jgi:hypothetical protein